jgi:threonine/homoserine/homoserine lactone efflux protein
MFSNLAPLAVFAAAMCLTPGPNVVMVTASTANFGFRKAMPQMFGITAGFTGMILCLGMGLSAVFEAEPRLHEALKLVGGGYLLYLAWKIANAGSERASGRQGRPISFSEAAAFQILNPKGWVIAVGALTTFMEPTGNAARQVAVIAAVLSLACLTSVLVWGAFGAAISRALRRSVLRTAFNRTMAGLLAVSLLSVFM